MRILVVEDDQLLNKTLSYNLSAVGYSVDGAMSKAVAIRFLEKQEYDLIVWMSICRMGTGLIYAAR